MPGVVTATAGAGKGLRVSDGSCSPQSPGPTPTSPAPTSSAPTQPTGTNLSIGAGSDGSGKVSGTSYGNVRDGDLSTYWSPAGPTGSVSIKWGSPTAVSTVVIRETAGSAGTVNSWRIVNGDTGAVGFPRTSLSEITYKITGSTGTPRVAEFETYA